MTDRITIPSFSFIYIHHSSVNAFSLSILRHLVSKIVKQELVHFCQSPNPQPSLHTYSVLADLDNIRYVRRRDGRWTWGSADPDPGLHHDQADLHCGENQGQGDDCGGEDLTDGHLAPLDLDDLRPDRSNCLIPLRDLLLLLHAPGHLQAPGSPRVRALQLNNRKVRSEATKVGLALTNSPVLGPVSLL